MPKRGGSKGQKKPSLSLLSREYLKSGEQVTEYFDQLHGASARTSALVGVAAIDQLLVQLLRERFIDKLDERDLDNLFYGY
jgi:hypothetical protein